MLIKVNPKLATSVCQLSIIFCIFRLSRSKLCHNIYWKTIFLVFASILASFIYIILSNNTIERHLQFFPTDRPSDRPTDKPTYRSSLPELKNCKCLLMVLVDNSVKMKDVRIDAKTKKIVFQ